MAIVSAASGIKKTLPPGRDLRFGYLSLLLDYREAVDLFFRKAYMKLHNELPVYHATYDMHQTYEVFEDLICFCGHLFLTYRIQQ